MSLKIRIAKMEAEKVAKEKLSKPSTSGTLWLERINTTEKRWASSKVYSK
jgi:hypothetical protein